MKPRRMRAGSLSTLAAAFLLLAASTSAQLTFSDGEFDAEERTIPLITLTHEDGAVSDQLQFAFETPEGEIYQSTTLSTPSQDIITTTDLIDMEVDGGIRNITATFDFEGLPGDEEFTVTTTTITDPDDSSSTATYELTGTYRIVGVVLSSGDGVVSGVGSNFMTGDLAAIREVDGLYEFDVTSWGPDGEAIDPNSFDIVVRAPGGEVSYDETTCAPLSDGPTDTCGVGFSDDGTKFFVKLNEDQLGQSTEPVRINIRNPELVDEMTGMEFQQELNIVVNVDSSEFSPSIASKSITADPFGGEFFDFDAFMFPESGVVSGVLPVGSGEWTLSTDDSTFDSDPIVVSFDTAAAGEDEESVLVSGGTFEVEDEDPVEFFISTEDGRSLRDNYEIEFASRDLAVTNSFDSEEAAGFSWLQLRLTLRSYGTETFSEHKNQQIIQSLASNLGYDDPASMIRLESVDSPNSTQRIAVYPWESVRQSTDGVTSTYGILYGDDVDDMNASTVNFITDGSLASSVFIRGDNIELAGEPELFAAPDATEEPEEDDDDDGGGLPVWARVVIGVAAGLLGLLLIGCCLFFFLGRDRDEDASTEPSFTVEGPASVPVPVEYPVVRDAFGRGHYETELGSGEVDPAAGLPVEHPRINSSL